MGNCWSTRWSYHRRRQTTGEAARLRVRDIQPSPQSSEAAANQIVVELDPSGSVEQRLVLVARPMRFGGRRWFVLCPWCGRPRMALYIPARGSALRCRQCQGLGYHSQRLARDDRLVRRMRRLVKRVGGDDFLEFPWRKPRHMHWSTFGRLAQEWEAANEARDAIFVQRFEQVLSRVCPAAMAAG